MTHRTLACTGLLSWLLSVAACVPVDTVVGSNAGGASVVNAGGGSGESSTPAGGTVLAAGGASEAGGTAGAGSGGTRLFGPCGFMPTAEQSEVAAAWEAHFIACGEAADWLSHCVVEQNQPPVLIPEVTDCSFVFPERELRTSYGIVQEAEFYSTRSMQTFIVINCKPLISPSNYSYDVATRRVTLGEEACAAAMTAGARVEVAFSCYLLAVC